MGRYFSIFTLVLLSGFLLYLLTPMDIPLYHTSFKCPIENPNMHTQVNPLAKQDQIIHLKDLSSEYDNWKSSFKVPSECISQENVTVVL